MLFHFLKYLQPTHYFQLYRKDGSTVFPVIEKLPKETIAQFQVEEKFKSEKSKEYDLSWQALQIGYIGNAETYKTFDTLPIVDEYRFLRKYFHPVWVFYVLILRFFSFKNPFIEISAWKKSSDVKRSNYLQNPIKHKGWLSFESSLVAQNHLVSIVIPTLNR